MLLQDQKSYSMSYQTDPHSTNHEYFNKLYVNLQSNNYLLMRCEIWNTSFENCTKYLQIHFKQKKVMIEGEKYSLKILHSALSFARWRTQLLFPLVGIGGREQFRALHTRCIMVYSMHIYRFFSYAEDNSIAFSCSIKYNLKLIFQYPAGFVVNGAFIYQI